MNLPLVPINTASADEIAHLYDIGLRRAQRIVEYRNAHGPFHGPDDLAKVKEVPAKLAYTLSPHIDWCLPQEPEPPKQRSWSDVIFWLVILICLLTAVLLMIALLLMVQQNPALGLVRRLAAIAGIGALMGFCGFVAFRLGVAFTQDRQRARQFARWALLSIAIALFVCIPLLFGLAFWWYTHDPARLANGLGQPGNELPGGALALLLLYLLMIPQILVWWRPQLADNRWLAGIFDMTLGFSVLLLLVAIRRPLSTWPLWILLLAGLVGGLVIIITIISVRRDESFFRTSLDFLDPRRRIQGISEINQWRYWVSTHLPNPDQQQQVQAALNEMHRPTTSQAAVKLLILGFGWWLLLTTVEAIVQMYALKIWESIFG